MDMNAFHNEDVVEELTTKRQGKIDSIGSTIANHQETQNNWRVYFLDGKEPVFKYFTKQEELSLIKCPHLG
jgi:hypothetical protein